MVIHHDFHLIHNIPINTRVGFSIHISRRTKCAHVFLLHIQNSGRAFRDANSSSVGRGGLVRYHLPYIGELADRWVSEE